MRYIITESQLNDFVKKHFKVDLTDKISMVTNKWELPMEFDRIITPQALNTYLNKYGPMFVITTRKNMYLAQDRGKHGYMIANQNDYQVSDLEVMKDLGIESLGLSVKDLIDQFFIEPINESKDSEKSKLETIELYMKRRYDIIKDMVEKSMDDTQVDNDWEDEFEYVESVIAGATDDLIFGTPQFNITGGDEDYDMIYRFIERLFGAKLFDHYYDNQKK